VLEVDRLQVLTDGGYSNAEEVARCEREDIEVAAPIKRGAMNSEHFRPAQFIYDEASDTVRARLARHCADPAPTPAITRSVVARRRAAAAR